MAHGNKTYTEEFKALVVADLLGGKSERQVAKKHGVSRGSVVLWLAQAFQVASPQKRMEIEARQELILHRYFDLIEAAVDAYTDRDWLRRQDAEGAAILIGVISDKASLLTLLRERLARNRLPASNPNVIDVPRVSGPRQDS